jgi:AAA+ ATPase superfamily predicted ATPase
MFVGRKQELNYLEEIYKSNNSEMTIVYGRRRIGKTELLRKFSRGKKHIFFSCDLSSESEQLRQFSKSVYRVTNEIFLKDNFFIDWNSALEYLFTSLPKDTKLVIIDEFPYMCNANSALPSILQNIWDKHSKNSQIKLILCGSYISFMEKEVLSSKSPLYGRRSGQIFLRQFSFDEATEMLPKYSRKQMIYIYSILGGIPAYLEKFDDKLSLEKNIKINILNKNSYLFAEPRFLLMEELRESGIYFSILRAISSGRTRLNEISQDTMINDRIKVNKYLSVLRELHIIERELPITEKNPIKSRKGIYKIEDQLIKFWFRFVYPNLYLLEENEVNYLWKNILLEQIDTFVGFSFEKICLEELKKMNKNNNLPFKFKKIGRWWDRNNEIDLLGYDDSKNFIFGECKWKNKKIGKKELDTLVKKSKLFDTKNKYFCFFSKSSFSPVLIKEANKENNIFLFKY